MRILSPAVVGIAAAVLLPLTVVALEFRAPTVPEPATLPAVADRAARPIGDAVGHGAEVAYRPAADRPTGIAGWSRPWHALDPTPAGFQSTPDASADSGPPLRIGVGLADCLNEPAGPWGHSEARPPARRPERAAPKASWWSRLRQ